MTTGIISIKQGSIVVMKIVAVSIGMMAETVAKAIKDEMKARNGSLGLRDAYKLALGNSFGSKDDLVVIDRTAAYHKTKEVLSPLYRTTFDRDDFNPVAENGAADYIEIVRI